MFKKIYRLFSRLPSKRRLAITSALILSTMILPILPVSAQTWTTKADMPTARGQAAVVLAPDGLIYVIGGFAGGYEGFSSVEAYDPATDTWTTKASLPNATRGAAASVGLDGKIYVFGGTQKNRVQIYDPTTDNWTTGTNIPIGSWAAGAATTPNGKIYLIGGEGADNRVQIYDPTTDNWTTGASMPTPRKEHSVVLGPDGLIYAMGGYNYEDPMPEGHPLSSVEAYDPATDTWTTKASLPNLRLWMGVTTGLSTAYIIGGGNGITYLNVVEEATGLDPSKIYVFGGGETYGNNGPPVYKDTWIYDPETDTWATGKSMPTARREQGSIVVFLCARITGTVFDEETGDPVEGANVTADGIKDTTNGDGLYSLIVLPGTYNLTVTKEGYFTNTTSVTVNSGDIHTANFTIIKYGTITGTVYDETTGEPVEGANVTANPTTITGPEGTYSLNVVPGTYTVTVTKEGYVTNTTEVTVGPGETRTIDFIISELATITGVVTDVITEDPVEGATVTANPSTTTGSDGRYLLSVPPGTYTLTISKQGYVTIVITPVTVDPGDTYTADVTVSTGIITGVVTDEETEDPIEGATITADGATDTTGPDGIYMLNVEPGTYTLTVTSKGYKKKTSSVTVDPGETETKDIIVTPAGLPIIPIVAGVGGVAAVAAVVILLMKRKPKKVPKPYALRISADPTELLSDGKSTSSITIGLLDEEGNLVNALLDMEVRLSTTIGRITSPVTIPKGESTWKAKLTSSTEIGEVRVSAESMGLMGASTSLTFMATLRISADPTELLSDGKSTSTITIELLNGEGELTEASQDVEVRLSTTLGTITSPVTIREGESTGRATLTSSTEFGEVTLSAEGSGLIEAGISLEFVERKRYCMHCGTRMALDVNLCPKCGRAPPSGVDVKICRNCGEVVPTVAKFCSACGASQPEETRETD